VQEHPVVQARPWRVLLACALCNRTKGRRALPILIDIVTRWPRAEDLAEARSADLEPLLRPLGLQRVRADRIVAMCRSIVRRGIHLLPYRHRDVRDIPGVGRYAQDAWSLFVIGRTDIEPRDKELAKWLHWRKQAAG
jgi:methyl-CpG-binding domain protein 4